MNYDQILYDEADGIATITLNRPGKLNAMNRAMMDELIDALERVHAAAATEVRVAVLAAEGRAFMAGADIKEYAGFDDAEFGRFQARGQAIYSGIERNRVPVLAALNGPAFGGGFEIALACDLIVAVEGTTVGLPEINLNLIPGGGGTLRLAEAVGRRRANELLMTGEPVEVSLLEQWGVVNHVWPADTFAEETRKLARSLAARPAEALTGLKQLTRLARPSPPDAALALENRLLSALHGRPEAAEAIQAFADRKRKKR